jgi:hypothetical protein
MLWCQHRSADYRLRRDGAHSWPPTGASFPQASARWTRIPHVGKPTWRRPIGRRSRTRLSRLGQRPSTTTVHLFGATHKRCSTPTRSIRASAPAPPKDRIAARPHEEPENDQQHAEDDRARNEHHDPRDDKGYGDDPQNQTDVTTHGDLPTHAWFLSHPRPDRPRPCRGDGARPCASVGEPTAGAASTPRR